mmetsp:Transcript_6211/g.22846  ORF Transcript_6211/g.22846 Transcript_6211/m.22846 type:complete len:235 (-) Transcript_6211:2691-3395(-)
MLSTLQRCGRTTWTKTCYSRAIISYLCGIRRRLFAPGIRCSSARLRKRATLSSKASSIACVRYVDSSRGEGPAGRVRQPCRWRAGTSWAVALWLWRQAAYCAIQRRRFGPCAPRWTSTSSRACSAGSRAPAPKTDAGQHGGTRASTRPMAGVRRKMEPRHGMAMLRNCRHCRRSCKQCLNSAYPCTRSSRNMRSTCRLVCASAHGGRSGHSWPDLPPHVVSFDGAPFLYNSLNS